MYNNNEIPVHFGWMHNLSFAWSVNVVSPLLQFINLPFYAPENLSRDREMPDYERNTNVYILRCQQVARVE